MIKYLETPDFHFAPEWSDISEQCGEAVRLAAIEHKVDFIAAPGDLFDKPLYASNRSKYHILIKIVKSWLAVCPVVVVEGTQSHDGPGCYGPLEELGLIVLNPRKVYGYHRYQKCIMEYNGTNFLADCILFGIPELNKNQIHAQLNVSAEEGNAEAVKALDNHIQSFVAPMRSKYPDIPAVGLLHGNVSDSRQENSSDIIMKASDIVIHTEILERAGLDRWALGHIHTPWESEKISAGYAGFTGVDSNPWGKRDFVPGFNLITIERDDIESEDMVLIRDFDTKITRIEYGTPERRKIRTFGEIELDSSNIAYWLETADFDITELPPGLHPWSRITYEENITETRRVTKEEAEKATTLWELFKLTDPDVSPDLKEKVDSIPEYKKDKTGNRLDARLTDITVKGCDLLGGKTVHWNLNELSSGLNQLIGTNGNGDGKSSALGMCSFYPTIIGKDTRSGRQSAIKDFFSGPDCSIEKNGIVNGQKHHHKITIKGADTQNPKVECYLNIEGIPQLEKATFDTMMEKCEELYGSYEDYLLTTFYEQPQQSRNQRSGLMTATMTEARNLVQNIAGVDREKEKRFALDEVDVCVKSEQQLKADIDALEKYSEDIEELERDKETKIVSIDGNNKHLETASSKGFTAKEEVDALQIKKTENETAKSLKQQKAKQVDDTTVLIEEAKVKISELRSSVASLEFNQELITDDDSLKKRELSYSELLTEYNRIMAEYEREVIEQGTVKREQQNIIDAGFDRIESLNREKELISTACPKCGYIDPEIQGKIDELDNSMELITQAGILASGTINNLEPIIKPELIEPIKPPTSLSESERSSIQTAINTGLKAETEIEGLEAAIKKDNVLLHSYSEEWEAIIIDEEIDNLLTEAETNLVDIRKQYTDIKSTISTLEAEKKAIEDRIKKAEEGAQELEAKRVNLVNTTFNHDAWTYIAKMLNPDKIPALELDIILDSIDAEATRNIKPFLEGRYSYKTLTQDHSKKNVVDRFDVMIHDAESGKLFSMFYTNPGNKAFYSDCYIKALIRKRNERQMRSYSPIIYDEADGPVNPIRVEDYYEIQKNYFKDEKVIIVSQKDVATNYVQKVFNIEDMKS